MSELDCAICHQLLLHPVTTVCGHTFCRGCLGRALDYRQQCPSCRAQVSANLSVNVLLASIVESRCPEELQRRAAEEEELLRASARAERPVRTPSPEQPSGSGGARAEISSIFPILTSTDKRTALLPQLLVTLDIRNSSSAQAALQQARSSGLPQVAVFQQSRASEGAIGVLCELVHAGEERAVLKAQHRVSLLEAPRIFRSSSGASDAGVLLGRVERVRDHEEDAQLMRAMAAEILELLTKQLSLIGRAGRTIFEDRFGQLPRSADTVEDFEKFSFWLCACLDTRGNWPLLLTTRSTLERLRLARGLMRNAGAHVVLAIATDRSWLRLRSGLAGVLGLLVLLLALWWHGRGARATANAADAEAGRGGTFMIRP